MAPGTGAVAVKRGLFIAKVYYFLFFSAIGALMPFFNVYLERKGLTGAELGWLGSIAPLIALTANPFWGTVADRWQIHRQALALCALGAGWVSLLFLPIDGFWPLLVLVTILYFFRTPINSLTDNAVINLVKKDGNASYGQQRLWGTLGFIVASTGLGQLAGLVDLSLSVWLHGGLLGLACAGLSLWLPMEQSGQKPNLTQGLRLLLGQRHYRSFLVAMVLQGMGSGAYIGFLGLHVLALGGAEQQIGLAWAANAIGEIPMMYFGGRWFARYQPRQLILVGYLGFAIIWGLVAVAPSAGLVTVILLGMGLCFGFFWVAAVSYASQAAPPGLSATAQALMGAAQGGLGWSLGSVVAGYLWDFAGGNTVFFFAACTSLAATLIFWLGNRSK